MMVFERVKKTLEQGQASDHSANKHERAQEKNNTIQNRFNQVDHESNLFPPSGLGIPSRYIRRIINTV